MIMYLWVCEYKYVCACMYYAGIHESIMYICMDVNIHT